MAMLIRTSSTTSLLAYAATNWPTPLPYFFRLPQIEMLVNVKYAIPGQVRRLIYLDARECVLFWTEILLDPGPATSSSSTAARDRAARRHSTDAQECAHGEAQAERRGREALQRILDCDATVIPLLESDFLGYAPHATEPDEELIRVDEAAARQKEKLRHAIRNIEAYVAQTEEELAADAAEHVPSTSGVGNLAKNKFKTGKTSGPEPEATILKGEPEFTPATFPEAGFQAWATVAGAFIVQFCGFGYTNSVGVYQDFYTREYSTESSASAISWIGSINAFIIISGGLVAGRFYDRGHFYCLICGGALLQCFSLFMLSFCKPQQFYQIFLAQGLGTGLGSGAMYVPGIAVISHYFQKRRALAMAIVASGSSLGAVVHPITLNNTLKTLGFGNAVRTSASLIGGLLIIACLLMCPRLPPSQTHLPLWKSLQRLARDKTYVLTTVGIATYAVGVFFPIFYLQLDAVKHGINKTLSFYSLVIMSSASFVGRLAPGFFAHRLGILNLIMASMGCGAVFILSMIALRTVASVVVIGVLYGLCIGLRMGVTFALMGIGGLIGPPVNGALLTRTFVWWCPALFSGVAKHTLTTNRL
ncbi:major facilitator superfamily domain-containing protein [Mycena leptocephala]|nr:major facilitator superfamily domain-containing protein [Mycena leptocephala]